jgi:hypothetical protein
MENPMRHHVESERQPVEFDLTRHARARSQQRSIPPFIIDLLLDFGRQVRSGHASKYLLDKQGRRKIRQYVGSRYYQQIEDKLNCWAVVGDDGAVVSVGHRTRRTRH